MPEFKYLHFSVVLSSILVLSACSLPEFMKVDGVDDTVAYQQAANSVRSLSIPPGLSNPGFDSTYSSLRANANAPATRPSASPPVNALDAIPATNAGSSLGSALMAQSGDNVQQRQMPQVAMIRLQGGEPAMVINEPQGAAWKSLAYALSGAGFKISKQQPDQGIMTTSYQGENEAIGKGKSYLILMAENASKQPFVGVADANGRPAKAAVANAVLSVLKTEFEK